MATINHAEGVDGLRQYLDFNVEIRRQHPQMSDPRWHYLCMEDFVLREGIGFTTFSPDQPTLDGPNRYRPRIPKACFNNSYGAAVSSKGRLRYVEGYAHGGFLPVHHAWNIDPDGLIVDVTWCGDERDLGPFTRPKPGTAYFGVVFDIEYVQSMRTKENCCVIDQWERGYPVLCEPFTS